MSRHVPVVEIFNNAVRTPEYRDVLKEKRFNSKIGAYAVFSEVFRRIAARKQKESNYETPEILQQKLIAALPEWLSSEKKINTRSREMTREERLYYLKRVIGFNHILREAIDQEVFPGMRSAMEFVKGSMLIMRYEKEDIPYALETFRATADGMRHEVAAASIASDRSDVYEARGAEGVDDEVHGIDLRVTFIDESQPKLLLDIKSTFGAARSGNSMSPSGRNVVWSGLKPEDFGDRLVLSVEELRRKGGHLNSEIDQLKQGVIEERIA